MKAENRHYDKVHKKKAHPAAKCGNTKCIICHSGKVLKIPTKKMLQEQSKLKDNGKEI
jgi:hypothetical protein